MCELFAFALSVHTEDYVLAVAECGELVVECLPELFIELSEDGIVNEGECAIESLPPLRHYINVDFTHIRRGLRSFGNAAG